MEDFFNSIEEKQTVMFNAQVSRSVVESPFFWRFILIHLPQPDCCTKSLLTDAWATICGSTNYDATYRFPLTPAHCHAESCQSIRRPRAATILKSTEFPTTPSHWYQPFPPKYDDTSNNWHGIVWSPGWPKHRNGNTPASEFFSHFEPATAARVHGFWPVPAQHHIFSTTSTTGSPVFTHFRLCSFS
jgi:hypothetical protein